MNGRAGRALALVALTTLGACGGKPPPPTPRPVAAAALAEATLVATVLDECHRPLRGRMDRIAAEVTTSQGAVFRVFARLPGALRVAGPDGTLLWRDGQAVDVAAPANEVPPATQARLAALRQLLDAAALGPLHRATGCRRLGDWHFALTTPDATWTLQLRPGTLLPHSLQRGEQTVELRDWLRTPTTWIVARAAAPLLGECRITFEVADLAFDDEVFELPGTAKAPSTPRQKVLPPGAEPRATTPQVSEARAVGWVVLDDPGEWPARAAAYAPVHAELERQQQAIPGFPILFEDGGTPRLAVPFRARPGQPALMTPTGWQVRQWPAARQLYVYPPAGDFAARATTGRQQLQQALQAQGLEALGPITVQGFFHLHEGPPLATQLAEPVVRVAVLVR